MNALTCGRKFKVGDHVTVPYLSSRVMQITFVYPSGVSYNVEGVDVHENDIYPFIATKRRFVIEIESGLATSALIDLVTEALPYEVVQGKAEILSCEPLPPSSTEEGK